MKRPFALAAFSLVFCLMFPSVALGEPAAEQSDLEKSEVAAVEQEGSALTTADSQQESLQARAKTPAANTPTAGAPVAAKTNLSSAKATTSQMMRNVVSGKQLKPQVVLQVAGKNLVEGKDYRLKYGSSTTAPSASGTYPVYAEALENSAYTGSVKIGDFKLIESSLDARTAYFVSPVANSNFMLDAHGKRPGVGSNITVWTRNNGNNQKWYFVLGNDGYYTIRNAANQSLTMDAVGKSPRVGANVSVWSNNNGLNQRWIIERSGSSFLIRSAANPNLVLDAAGKNPRQGANVSVWTNNGQNNQKWSIKSMNDIYAELDSFAAKNKGAVADGTYVIYANSISGCPVLDVKGGATSAGANIQTANSNSASSQLWELSHSGDYVLIKNKKSGKYLSVAGSNSSSGANVILGSNANDRGAKWIFVKNSSGGFSVRSALHTGIALDIFGGRSAAGTNVETWTVNSNKSQKFSLVSAPAQVAVGTNVIDTSGYYFIKSFKSNSLQLDVTAASKANNANIELWSTNKAPWQIFRFEYVNGYYRIISVHTNKALTVQNNSLVPGANVVTYTVSGNSANQLWQAKKNADGSYSFVNKQNGFALQAASGSQKAGTNINTSWASFGVDQKFKLERLTHLMPTGIYNLRSALSNSQGLDVAKGSKSDKANVDIWGANNDWAQKWSIQTVNGKENVYTLQAVCSGKYLADNGAGNAIQVVSGASANSQWKASIVGGSYVLTNVGTGRVLDVTNSKASSGTNVGTKPYTGGVNQRWNLVSTAPIPNGTYIIRSKVNSSKVLEVSGASAGNNANAALWGYNGGAHQKFTITRNSDDTYTIVNCNSGKALDATAGRSTPGTNVAQYARNGKINQRWRLVYTNDGAFKFVSAANSAVVLAFNGTSPGNGLNACLVKDTGAAAQHFTLEKTTPPLPSHQRDMLNRAQGYSSGTGYLILVDRRAHRVGVFGGSQGNWSYRQYWSCVTGAPGSPTITGVYRTTGGKRMSLTTDSRARWCTQINGGYFFHTILASESELGKSLSHGCIRMAVPSAQWIYHNIGRGTTVVIYN